MNAVVDALESKKILDYLDPKKKIDLSSNAKQPEPLEIVRLLRKDIFKGKQRRRKVNLQSDRDELSAWWFDKGCYEYPAWGIHTLKDQYGTQLLNPLLEWPSFGHFGMSPFLLHLLKNRQDVNDSFNVQTHEGLWLANAWLYVYGLNEHCAMELVDDTVITYLNKVPPFFELHESHAHSAPSWLMFFLWRLNETLQMEYDLRDPRQWDRYIAWFLVEGVNAYGLGKLVAEEWKEKIRSYFKNKSSDIKLSNQNRKKLSLKETANFFDRKYLPGNYNWAISSTSKNPKDASNVKRPFGVNLIGFAFGELGIGEDIRMAAESFEEAGIPVSIVNISPGAEVRQKDMSLLKYMKAEDSQEAPYSVNIFCLTAFDTARVYLEKGKGLFEGRYNIGWWPWELPVWPKQWDVVFDLVHEVWGSTTYTTETYKSALKRCGKKTAIKKVPLKVSIDRLKPMSREELGLPEDRFLFLYVFDSNSYLSRKNPFGALKAFQNAFKGSDKKVGMVFKTMNPKHESHEYQKFKKACLADSRVILIENTMDRGEVLGLMNACDAYVSLHRAEGFGRTIAEALMLKKPTIATDFSGNTDFEGYIPVKQKKIPVKEGEYPFVESADNAWWADPSVHIKSCFLEAMGLKPPGIKK